MSRQQEICNNGVRAAADGYRISDYSK